MALQRVIEFETLLHDELLRLEATRDEADKKALDKEIQDGVDELEGLNETFR